MFSLYLQAPSIDSDLNDNASNDNASGFDYESQFSPQSTSTLSSKSTDQTQAKKKKKGAQTSDADHALLQRCEKILAEEVNPKDALTVFGDYVVSQLRRFETDELLQIETQNAIQKCLRDATAKYVAKKYLVVDNSGNLHPYSMPQQNENAGETITDEMDTEDVLNSSKEY